MQQKLTIRIIINAIIFISAIFGLWWLMYPVGIFGAWYYKRFYEFPLAALLLDTIYSAPLASLFNFQFVNISIALIAFLIIALLKTKLRKEIWQTNF